MKYSPVILSVPYYFVRRKLSYWKQEFLLLQPKPRIALKNICDEVMGLIEQENSDLGKVTIIRNWVNQNSVHLIDDEHDSYAFNISKVVVRIWGFRCAVNLKPHLSCGPRAYLLKEILDRLDYKTRIIDILEIVEGEPRSHTLVEYFDNQLNKWVMQDPDFNVYFRSRLTGEILSASECLFMNKLDIEFDSSKNKIENLANLTETVVDYFNSIVVYRYAYSGEKTTVIMSDTIENYTMKQDMPLEKFLVYIDRRYIRS